MNQSFRIVDSKRISSIESDESLVAPIDPILPIWSNSITIIQRLISIQAYIEEFQYNYTNRPYVQIQKSRSTKHLCKCAKDIIKAGMPIQCVEATYIGIYLTSVIPQVDRIPLSFKSRLVGDSGPAVYRHIVLAMRVNGKWGSLGISRRENLMWKDLKYATLSDLIEDFSISYRSCCHELLAVYLGLPFPHDLLNTHPVKWKVVRISMHQPKEDIKLQFAAFSNNMTKVVSRASTSDNSILPKL
jgi:hypothetical protein